VSKVREQFLSDGYLLIRGGIPPALLGRLQADLDPLIGARDTGGTSLDWRHQTILEPKHCRRSFVDFLDLPSINDAAREVVGTEDLSFAGLAVLLGRKVHSVCKWHRDFSDSDPEIEELLKHPTMLIQFNCAVFDDAALWVVPGSHRRASLPEERAFAAKFAGLEFTGPIAPAYAIDADPLGGMPGCVHVALKAGDCLLYNPVIWHAAEYRPDWKRATLHGGWRDAAKVDAYRALRWGLEHNPWLMQPSYLGDLGANFRPQLERYQGQVRRHVKGTT
jgi:hypothetical protein